MPCPPEIAAIVAEILSLGILRIRAQGWSGNADRCAIEADHRHNLSALLVSFTPDLLAYYWEVERAGFIERSLDEDVAVFKPSWIRLANFVSMEIAANKLRPAI